MTEQTVPVTRAEPSDIEEVLTALSGSGTLDLLGLTADNLQAARTDSGLFETLRITHDLLVVMRDEGVLGTFLLLPEDKQSNFIRWIASMDDEDLRQERTGIFISALKQAPLADSSRYADPE